MLGIRFIPTFRGATVRRPPDWPVWGPALATATVVPALGHLISRLFLPAEDQTWILAPLHLIESAVVAVVCYFLVHGEPRRAFYAPLACNLRTVLVACTDPNPWPRDVWLMVAGGWILSIVAAAAAWLRQSRRPGRDDNDGKIMVR